jgi:hypothetical protein
MCLLHSIGILTHPDREWESIRTHHESTSKLYLGHILAFALIPTVSAYFGASEVGWRIGDGEVVKLTQSSAAQLCVLFYAAMISGIFILGKFIDFFALTYGVDESEHNGVLLAAYTATPLFIVGATALYPDLWMNMIAGVIAVCWSVYLLYEGLPILMKIPEDRGFIFASSVLTVGLCMLVGLLAISVIIWSVGFGPVYTS